MSSGNNPFAGRVPLHLRKADQAETIEKSTSYRPGITHQVTYRTPQNDRLMRNEGCTPLRRYATGQLDVPFVAGQVIDIVHKVQNLGNLTGFEKALLSVILPSKFSLVDPALAHTMARLTDTEKMMVALKVQQHMSEEENWNAGRGGGSVPFRSTTRS